MPTTLFDKIRNAHLAATRSDDRARIYMDRHVLAGGAQPFTIDLAAQLITCPDRTTIAFEIDAADRTALLQGLDEIRLTLQNAADIAAFEQRCRAAQPWLQSTEHTPS